MGANSALRSVVFVSLSIAVVIGAFLLAGGASLGERRATTELTDIGSIVGSHAGQTDDSATTTTTTTTTTTATPTTAAPVEVPAAEAASLSATPMVEGLRGDREAAWIAQLPPIQLGDSIVEPCSKLGSLC